MNTQADPREANALSAATMKRVLEDIQAFMAEREQLARTAAVGACPKCGAPVRTAEWGTFIEPGIGWRDRLVVRCDAGCEWVHGDVAMGWLNSDDLLFVRRQKEGE